MRQRKEHLLETAPVHPRAANAPHGPAKPQRSRALLSMSCKGKAFKGGFPAPRASPLEQQRLDLVELTRRHVPTLEACDPVVGEDQIEAEVPTQCGSVVRQRQLEDETVGRRAEVRIAAFRVEDQVPQAVDDPATVVELDLLHHVGAVSDDHVDSGVDEVVPHLRLIVRFPAVVATPMGKGHDEDVRVRVLQCRYLYPSW